MPQALFQKSTNTMTAATTEALRRLPLDCSRNPIGFQNYSTTNATNSRYQEKTHIRIGFEITITNVPRGLARKIVRKEVSATSNWFGPKTLTYKGEACVGVDAETLVGLVSRCSVLDPDGSRIWKVAVSILRKVAGLSDFMHKAYASILSDLELRGDENATWSGSIEVCDYEIWKSSIPYYRKYNGKWNVELVWDDDTRAAMLEAISKQATSAVRIQANMLGITEMEIETLSRKLKAEKRAASSKRNSEERVEQAITNVGMLSQELLECEGYRKSEIKNLTALRTALNARRFMLFGELFELPEQEDEV